MDNARPGVDNARPGLDNARPGVDNARPEVFWSKWDKCLEAAFQFTHLENEGGGEQD